MKFIVRLDFTDGAASQPWLTHLVGRFANPEYDNYEVIVAPTKAGWCLQVEVEAPNYSIALNAAYEVITKEEMPQWPVQITVTESWYAKRGD